MEIIKEKLRQNEIRFFERIFEKSYSKLELVSTIEPNEIAENKIQLKKLKIKFPFLDNLIQYLMVEQDYQTLKTKICLNIVEYLNIIYKNKNVSEDYGNFQSISKRNYMTEKKAIALSLKDILYHANLSIEIQKNLDNEIENKFETEKSDSHRVKYFKPGVVAVPKYPLVVVKYLIIHKFYKKENPYSNESKYQSVGEFLEQTAKIEKFNPGTFKNTFYKISNENLDRYCKSKPELIQELKDRNSFKNFPKCIDFISQFDKEEN